MTIAFWLALVAAAALLGYDHGRRSGVVEGAFRERMTRELIEGSRGRAA